MRTWHVEVIRDRNNYPQWAVLRENGQLYAQCINQSMAANVCTALNFHEQWIQEEADKSSKGAPGKAETRRPVN